MLAELTSKMSGTLLRNIVYMIMVCVFRSVCNS